MAMSSFRRPIVPGAQAALALFSAFRSSLRRRLLPPAPLFPAKSALEKRFGLFPLASFLEGPAQE
jgi:hypothetical protein